MLSEIRERATGWIAYIIVGIIIIPFAFWGVNQYFAGGEEVVVATVKDVEIQQVDYRRTLENRRRQMRQILGESFDPELVNSPEFKRTVLDDMIARALLNQHAEEQGYRVGDEELAERIRSNPRFQDGETFSPEAYRSQLARMGMNEAGFESSLRQQIVLQQLRDGVRVSAFTTPAQEQQLLRLMLQQRRFNYAVLDNERFIADREVSGQEIQQEYDANNDRYRTPERMKIEYAELSVKDLAENVSVTEEDIRQAYERNRERFTDDAMRRASHILIEVEEDAGAEAEQQALEKTRSLLQRIRDGADFAALAREHSDDPGSASKGGDLGRVETGVMVEPFEEALFALEEEGAVTEPVRTRYGYHIIKLTEYQPSGTKPLEEVRGQLVEEERKKQAEALFLDRAEAFRNISYEQPQSLEPVADQLDLEIRTSDWFTRSDGTGVASNPDVREAAFSDDVYNEGLNSTAVELDINTLVVVRKLEVQPSTLQPLEEVRDDIVGRIKRRKAREHVASLGPKLVARLQSEAGWQAVIDEHELVAQQVTLSRADEPSAEETAPPADAIKAVFRARTPSGAEPVYGGVALPDGDYTLFRLVEVIEGDVDKAPEDVETRVLRRLEQRRSQDMVQQYIADLREQGEVTVREEAL